MNRLLSVLVIALVFSTTAMGVEIAISTQGGWMGQGHADTESQVIVDSVTGAPIEVFTPTDLDALADWVEAHTGNGVSDLLVMFGIFPATIYPAGNAQPDGSLAEAFLDDGNCIINTGDYIFYVGSAGNNDAGGLANMTDVPAAGMWGDDSGATTFAPTADGQLYTPSLPTLPSNRPWIPAQFEGTDWYFELILAQSDDGTQAHPAILRNSVTGGRLGVFFQRSDDTQPRGAVMSEWINNWYLKNVDDPRIAKGPVPADGAGDIPPDSVLSWTPGQSVATHDVYFGAVFDDVNDASRSDTKGVLVSQGQSDAAFDPDGDLDFGVTYYWRIDEVNGAPDNTIFKGKIWSFTAEPFAYPIEGVVASSNGVPQGGASVESIVNGSGLNEADEHSVESTDMWLAMPGADPLSVQFELDGVYKLDEMLVWNYNVQFELVLGFGIKDVAVEYSTDGAEWTVLGDVALAQATANASYTANTTIDFGGVAAKYVRLTVNSGQGMMGQYGLSEVRFMYIPAMAREPEPADGATDVSVATDLTWRAGRDAASHDVYLGTDAEALELAGTTDVASYSPDALQLNTAYSWQIDEIQDAGSWAGPVWSFTTQAYLVVDDFESYDDEENRIYQSWIDGYGVNSNGSTVGHLESPFAEQTIVKSGNQSMPLFYDNAGASMSEAELTLAGQDWSGSGVKSLTLSFRGDTNNGGGQLYVKINGTKIPYDGDAADIGIGGWKKWSIVLADIGANLSSVTSVTIGIEGAGAAGVVYIDDIRLSPEVSALHTSDTGIAISGQANWWSQEAADREIEEIVDNTQAPVVVFNAGDQDGLADWLSDHTNNGVANLLILTGQLPDTIYEPGNVQADDSIVEQFLDAGNTVINTGDWMFYVVNGAGTNGAAGLQTIMDIPAIAMGGDDTAVTVTADGQTLTPTLQDFATDRPFHLDELEGDWSAELVLAQNADGTRADPVIVRNSATGGRIGIFYQTNNQNDDPRGEVISEWINNWYLDAASGN